MCYEKVIQSPFGKWLSKWVNALADATQWHWSWGEKTVAFIISLKESSAKIKLPSAFYWYVQSFLISVSYTTTTTTIFVLHTYWSPTLLPSGTILVIYMIMQRCVSYFIISSFFVWSRTAKLWRSSVYQDRAVLIDNRFSFAYKGYLIKNPCTSIQQFLTKPLCTSFLEGNWNNIACSYSFETKNIYTGIW